MSEESSRSALRALEIFEAFREAGRPMSLSEVARMTSMPVSTCHSVFKALEQRGFLYIGPGREAYPTRLLWDLACAINAHDPIAARLEPSLMRLRDEVDETVILGVRHGESVLYLHVLESQQSIRYSSRPGEHKPLYSSAIGKVMLGAMTPDQLDQWLKETGRKRITERTIVSATRIKADLAESAQRGYYATRGENVPDVLGIAAPLRLGNSVFGVAIAGPLQRLAEKEAPLARRLLRLLKTLEASG